MRGVGTMYANRGVPFRQTRRDLDGQEIFRKAVQGKSEANLRIIEAVEDRRVPPGGLVLMPAFGGGLTLSSHLIRWGERVTPLATTEAELPPCPTTALELVEEIRARKREGAEVVERFADLRFVEDRAA